MLTCSKLIPQGQGLATVLLKRAATTALDWAARQHNALDTTDSLGRALRLALPPGTSLRGGDVLLAEDGSMVRVLAAPQPLLRIAHCSAHGSLADLTRAAYHLGLHNTALELQADHLKILPNHGLADMLQRMHLTVAEVNEAFEPENGAYSAHGGHGAHGHGAHGHAHAHSAAEHAQTAPAADTAHAAPAAPAPAPVSRGKPIGVAVVGAVSAAPAAAVPHVHGPGCGHHH